MDAEIAKTKHGIRNSGSNLNTSSTSIDGVMSMEVQAIQPISQIEKETKNGY